MCITRATFPKNLKSNEPYKVKKICHEKDKLQFCDVLWPYHYLRISFIFSTFKPRIGITKRSNKLKAHRRYTSKERRTWSVTFEMRALNVYSVLTWKKKGKHQNPTMRPLFSIASCVVTAKLYNFEFFSLKRLSSLENAEEWAHDGILWLKDVLWKK